MFNFKQRQFNLETLAPPASTDGIVSHEHHARVCESIGESAGLTVPFLVMNVLAAIVACCGLFADSPAVVFGAMLVATTFGPISGIALALVDGNGHLLGKSMVAQLMGAGAVLGTSFVIGLIHRDNPLTHEIQIRTAPDLLSLTIALAAGVAAAYSTVSPRLNPGLIGAVAALSVVPPLSVCGLCLGRSEPALARGSFELFLTDFVAILFASSVVLWLHGYHGYHGAVTIRGKHPERLFLTNVLSLLSLLLLTFITGISVLNAVAKQSYQASVREYLKRKLTVYPGVHLADVQFSESNGTESVVAVLHSPYSLSPKRVHDIEISLPQADGKDTKFEVMAMIAKETNRDGYLSVPARTEPVVAHTVKAFGQ